MFQYLVSDIIFVSPLVRLIVNVAIHRFVIVFQFIKSFLFLSRSGSNSGRRKSYAIGIIVAVAITPYYKGKILLYPGRMREACCYDAGDDDDCTGIIY
jgi:hypothetical protein